MNGTGVYDAGSGIAATSGEAGSGPSARRRSPRSRRPRSGARRGARAGTSLAFGLPCMSTNCAKRNSTSSSSIALADVVRRQRAPCDSHLCSPSDPGLVMAGSLDLMSAAASHARAAAAGIPFPPDVRVPLRHLHAADEGDAARDVRGRGRRRRLGRGPDGARAGGGRRRGRRQGRRAAGQLGTMGNALGVRVHCAQGDELYADGDAHVCKWEGGGPAALWGVQVRMLPALDGRPSPHDAQRRHPRGRRRPTRTSRSRAWSGSRTRTRDSGGRVWPLDELDHYTRGRARPRARGAHGRRAAVQRGDGPRRAAGAGRASARTPCSSASPRGSARPSARSSPARPTSWRAPAASASCWAAACARPA